MQRYCGIQNTSRDSFRDIPEPLHQGNKRALRMRLALVSGSGQRSVVKRLNAKVGAAPLDVIDRLDITQSALGHRLGS